MNTLYQVPAMCVPLDAELTLPGSKSQANRAIVCACLSTGTSMIKNATPCEDVAVMVENLQKLGFHLEWINHETGLLKIQGGIPKVSPGSAVLDCHNAGTALRFLTSVAALVPGTWTITGNAHMRRRPIHDLVIALRSLGVQIEDTNGALPIVVHGGTMKGGKAELKADISSQYLTSLLLVAPCLPGGLTVSLTGPLASKGYVDLTKKVMADFGVAIEFKPGLCSVLESSYKPNDSYEVEGDWSAAGAWFVIEAITGSRINFTNLSRASEQSDRELPGIISTMCSSVGNMSVDCSEVPDQLMNLAVLASFRTGVTTFTGGRNLRHKECDRLHVTAAEFKKVGIAIEEYEDGVIVTGAKMHVPRHPVTLDPHHDHRMAMCFAILGLRTGHVSISHPGCVKKSYPHFFADLDRVLKCTKPIAIVGMRGAGKSSLARKLGSKLKLKVLDSDHLFQDQHGPIRDFIAARGWPAFRQAEAEIIRDALQKKGIVLSCGGGAIETPEVRILLKDHAHTVWLKASEWNLIQRLKSGKRPALTTLPLDQEVKKLTEERAPYYAEVSVIEVPSHVLFSRQSHAVITSLMKRLRSYDLHTRTFPS